MESLEISKYFDECGDIPSQGIFLSKKDTLGGNLVKEGYQVALIGVPSESDEHNLGTDMAPNAVRKQLYELSASFLKIKVADLGNIKTGKREEDARFVLEEVVGELVKQGVIPIVIGGTQELTHAMLLGLKNHLTHIRTTIIDSKIDLKEEGQTLTAHNYLQDVMEDECVSELNLLGIQNYYCTPWQIKKLVEHDCFCKRLRDVRGNTHLFEPILRDSDLFSFDFSSVRQSDAPGRAVSIPNGLSGLEACELGHYAGLSDSILAYGLFGFNPTFDNSDQTSALMAQVIWHIISGIDNRYSDYPKKSISEYRKYVVYPKVEGDQSTIFYNNILNGRWWIEIPTLEGNKVFACTSADYQTVCNNSIPDIWMRHYMK